MTFDNVNELDRHCVDPTDDNTSSITDVLQDLGHDFLKTAKQIADKLAEINKQLPKEPDATPVGSVFNFAAAFKALNEKLGSSNWKAINGNQQEVLKYSKELKDELAKLPPGMVEALASEDVEELNKWLKDRGFDIKLDPLGRGGVGMVAAFKLDVKWKGTDYGKMKAVDGNEYDAFKLKENVAFYKVDGHDSPIIKLHEDPKTGVKVYATPFDGNLNGLDAAIAAEKLMNAPRKDCHDFHSVVAPKVDLNRSNQVGWMLGMYNPDTDHVFNQFQVQTIIKMDQDGVEIKEAIAGGAVKATSVERPEVEYRLDKPFLLWVEVNGVKTPIFASKIDPKYWSDPKKK